MPEPKPSDAAVEQRHREAAHAFLRDEQKFWCGKRVHAEMCDRLSQHIANFDAERDVLARSPGVTAEMLATLDGLTYEGKIYGELSREIWERKADALNQMLATSAEQQESRTNPLEYAGIKWVDRDGSEHVWPCESHHGMTIFAPGTEPRITESSSSNVELAEFTQRPSWFSPKDDPRQWLIRGGGGHEDGEDGLRALTVTGEGLVDFLESYRDYLASLATPAEQQEPRTPQEKNYFQKRANEEGKPIYVGPDNVRGGSHWVYPEVSQAPTPTGQATEAKLQAADERELQIRRSLARLRTDDDTIILNADFNRRRILELEAALSATRPSGQGEREGEEK